ncbi:MAG: MFS transporter [Xanthomonadales bacterium]|nr:MFS transporter [Xanthomonadales bacterium]
MQASRVRWRILAIIVLASFISYVLRYNTSTAAPAMIGDLGLTEIQFGYVLAAFAAGYAIFQFPGGILGDRFGPRKMLTVIAVLWALLTALTSLVPSAETASTAVVVISLMVVRFLVGASHAPIFPVVNTSVVRWFPVGGWALPHGLSSTGLTLGVAASAPLLAWMITEVGWRAAFLLLAPLGLLVAAVWWWYARDNPAQHAAANEAEIELIQDGCELDLHSGDKGGRADWLRVLKNRDVLLLTLSYTSMNYVFYIVFNWFFYYLVEIRQYSITEAGFVTAAQWVAGAAGAAVGGWLCDRMCKRVGLRWGCRWPIVIGMSASGLLLLGGALHPSPQVAVTALAFCFFFNQLNEGPYWATSIAVGGKHAGAAAGVMNTGANIMGIVNALLVPALAHLLGWVFAIASGAFFALLGIVFILLVRADRPVDSQ